MNKIKLEYLHPTVEITELAEESDVITSSDKKDDLEWDTNT